MSFDKSCFGEETLVKKYERWLTDMSGEHLKNERYALYSSFIEEERAYSGERPFLSVVTRTQGQRPEELSAALHSLYEQTDKSFELIILGHKLSDEGRKTVLDIIDSQPEELKSKIRFFEVNYGNRSAPLNYGFAHARGTYIANLDDDDLLLPNYVRALHEAADEAGGRLIHSYGISQKWYKNKIGTPFPLYGNDFTDDKFCKDFDLMSQLYINYCYFTTIAFPRYIFHDVKIWFDETLETTEDWDYIMRCALILGVYDIRKCLSVYRLWQNSESSCTAHSKEVWDKNYDYILEKFASYPILFDTGSSDILANSKKLVIAVTGVVSKEPVSDIGEIVVSKELVSDIGEIGAGKLFYLKGLIKSFVKPGSLFYGFFKKAYGLLVKIRRKILDANE